MSDTNNTPDFTLYNQFLKSINTKLDEAITEQFENKNTGKKMDFTNIKNLLEQADTVALNVGNMVAGLSNDAITYEVIKAEIDKSMQEIKGKINNFKNNVVTDKKDKSKLNSMVEANIDKGKTSKALDAFAELHKEKGDLNRDKVDRRINAAKKEKEMAEKILDQRDDYDKTIASYITANPTQSKTDAQKALNDEFKNLKTANESWKKEVQRLQRIGLYEYEDKLGELINLAQSPSDVTPELAKEFKNFRKRVEDFSNTAVSQYFSTIDKDPTNEDIDTIRNILNNFSSVDLQAEPEMKEPEKVLKTIQDDYENLVNGKTVSGVTLTYIFEAFPDMKDEILSGIENGNTGKIDKILNQTGTMLRNFAKKDAKDLELDRMNAIIKIKEYEREKDAPEKNSNSDAPQEEPQPPEDDVTDELDVSDLVGEDLKLKLEYGEVDSEGNSIKYNFATIEDDVTKNYVVDDVYSELCKNQGAYRNAINKLLPTVPKKQPGNWFTKLFRNLKNRRLEKKGKPTVEAQQTEKAIKDVLKKKIEERIEKGKELDQYENDKIAYNKNFELNKKEKDKFNQAMGEIIKKYAMDKKDMKVKNIQNQMKKEAEDRVLGIDDD